MLTHPAGRNSKGTVDVFVRSSDVNLVALFGPIRGIWGRESIGSRHKTDQRTGLPVFSLYGNSEMSTEDISEIDTVVIDHKDVGVRCYTLKRRRYAMEACFGSRSCQLS